MLGKLHWERKATEEPIPSLEQLVSSSDVQIDASQNSRGEGYTARVSARWEQE